MVFLIDLVDIEEAFQQIDIVMLLIIVLSLCSLIFVGQGVVESLKKPGYRNLGSVYFGCLLLLIAVFIGSVSGYVPWR